VQLHVVEELFNMLQGSDDTRHVVDDITSDTVSKLMHIRKQWPRVDTLVQKAIGSVVILTLLARISHVTNLAPLIGS
jgi:hypothetical protein